MTLCLVREVAHGAIKQVGVLYGEEAAEILEKPFLSSRSMAPQNQAAVPPSLGISAQ